MSAIESITHFQRSLAFVALFQGRRASPCSALAPGYSSPRRWRSGVSHFALESAIHHFSFAIGWRRAIDGGSTTYF
ncbi:MAG: hypothetical protein QOF62_2794 [Pyrinomonadaceae bacterium]|jgi:hypothetical protein|nr:hypothetical protein [Pyrinomonadaceae bacterium]